MTDKTPRFDLFGEERAVSPVIGVILMVAITVILAAVIGTFVLDLGDDVQTTVQAGATVDVSDEQIQVTWTSNQNANELQVSTDGCTDGTDPTDIDFTAGQLEEVGDTFSHPCNSGDTVSVTIRAHGDDGNMDVILSTEVEV